MSDRDVRMQTKNLDQLIKALKGKLPRVKIGVLGDKAARSGNGLMTNAAIGAVHEYGSENHPVRSFLRVPISDNLKPRMEKAGAFTKEDLLDVIKTGTIVPWLKKVAVLAEGIVAEAFETGGFGKWKPWKNPNYKNGDNRILVDTGQLRDSITTEIK